MNRFLPAPLCVVLCSLPSLGNTAILSAWGGVCGHYVPLTVGHANANRHNGNPRLAAYAWQPTPGSNFFYHQSRRYFCHIRQSRQMSIVKSLI